MAISHSRWLEQRKHNYGNRLAITHFLLQSRISPHLGRAGGPYAKTVTAKTILPADLPDPELVFEGKTDHV